MPRDKAILKEQLAQLSKKELVEMLLKQAADQGFDTSKVEFTQHDCRP